MSECVSEKFLNRSFPFIHSSFFLVVGAVLCDSKKFFFSAAVEIVEGKKNEKIRTLMLWQHVNCVN